MSEITFKGCKQLDFEPHFLHCELVSIEDHVCWQRLNPPYEGAPILVQFCKLRGRINNPFSCVNGNGNCADYDEIEINL